MANTVADIERAAITILAQTYSRHPGLQDWVQAIADNPDETRQMKQYLEATPPRGTEPGVTWQQVYEERGYDPAHCDWSAIVDVQEVVDHIRLTGLDPEEWTNDFAGRLYGIHNATGEQERTALHLLATSDAAIAWLAYRLVQYREFGRPVGDYELSPIMGMGSPLAYEWTSLAAAVAEYCHRMAEAHALELAFCRQGFIA